MAKINGLNARCLSRITGKSAHLEASPRTRTYDLTYAVRKCRHQWLGHILRMPDHRLIKHAVRVQFHMGLPGNLLTDAPPDITFEQLVAMASNRKKWKDSWSQDGVFDDFVYHPVPLMPSAPATRTTNSHH